MLKKGDNGNAVKALQLKVIALGYPLPRFGADGNLGFETLSAVELLLREHNYKPDEDRESISDDELNAIEALYSKSLGVSKIDALEKAGRFFDRRQTASNKTDGGPRSWQMITGITLHQTSCLLGENPPRWDTVGAHVGVTRSGKVIWMHDFTRIIWHGNGFNTKTVGIEIDGRYEGVEGNPKTLWDDPSTPQHEVANSITNETVETTKQAIRWIVDEVARHGGKVSKLVAHRQSSRNRRDDPGSGLWSRVGLPMKTELGLDDGGPGFKIDTGYAIPVEWDPSRSGFHY